jgi:hypothetical protein
MGLVLAATFPTRRGGETVAKHIAVKLPAIDGGKNILQKFNLRLVNILFLFWIFAHFLSRFCGGRV